MNKPQEKKEQQPAPLGCRDLLALNLYRISQSDNNDYDTFDSAVVAAPDKKTAAKIHPEEGEPRGSTWSWSSQVKVEFIGVAKKGTKEGVILASYNAG